jgi:hypothetical protein
MKNYAWLQMVRLIVGVYQKNTLPAPQHITFSADPRGLQDMMNKAMHQTMIDQSKVLANTIINCLTETLKKGIEEGYWDLHTFDQSDLLHCS